MRSPQSALNQIRESIYGVERRNMKPTINLRYLQIKVPTVSNIRDGYSLETKLQQQWISNDGKTEWRNVEIVKETVCQTPKKKQIN